MTNTKLAVGYTGDTKKGNTYKIAVAFPADLFAKIRQRAATEKRSFSAQVIELCKVGELDLIESDREELETRPTL